MPHSLSANNRPRRAQTSLARLSGIVLVPLLSTTGLVTPTPTLVAADSVAMQAAQKVDTVMVDWRMLGGLNYDTGEMTDTLKKLNGKIVKIPGFVVPLEDYEEEAAEFLLVPYSGACVHTPPPPPNQLVYVKMANKKKMKVGLWDAVWMYGTLKVEFIESVYGPASFTLEGLRTAPYGTP